GSGAQPFRMFDSTAVGQWRLWETVWMLARVSMGWPSYLVCVSGVVLSFWPVPSRVEGRGRPGLAHKRLWWALLPALSYHLTFMAVVGFTYDRFLMPMFLSLALAGGFCASYLDRAAPPVRIWSRAAFAGMLTYTFAYVLVIDV